MRDRKMNNYKNLYVLAAAFLWWFAGLAAAQDYTLSDLQFLPGDTEIQTSVNDQNFCRIAARGPGFLIVWQDERTNLINFNLVPASPLLGNQTDIYAARLDSAGNLLDDSPIIISNEGTHQTIPDVAWNGENWLVVYTTQRPDWYFFTDLYATRVSPDGVVLDTPPIPIRLENNSPSNDYGQNPSVSSDGTNWIVSWQDQTWQGTIPYPNITGVRVAPDGTILDDPAVVLYQATNNFGPGYPRMAFAADEFLLVWERAGYHQIFGRRLDQSLNPLDANEFMIAPYDNERPRVTSNGVDFFVLSRQRYGFRVNHAGQVLDPSGIYLGTSLFYNQDSDVTWDGTYWVAAHNGLGSFSANLYLTKVTTSGLIVAPGPTRVQFSVDDQDYPALASVGDGSVILAWEQRAEDLMQGENIRSVRVDANWNNSNEQDVSVGLHRQVSARFATNGNEHMAVFVSQGGNATRILAQRVDADGNVLNPEPTLIKTTVESTSAFLLLPRITFNGSQYLVVWTENGSAFGVRLQPDGTVIDQVPITLATDNIQEVDVSWMNGYYYMVYSYIFSFDQMYLKGARLDGSTLALVDTPTLINPSTTLWALTPQVYTFGNRWLVVWEAQATHDLTVSTIRGIFVNANGQANPPFQISQGGHGDDPEAAIVGDRTFIAWYDDATQGNYKIKGRLLAANGTFLGNEFDVCNTNRERISTTASWDGSQFVVAWIDFRSLTGVVEQWRGDVWAARIDYEGNVLDQDGFQVTSGSLPEDLPAVAGANGKSLIAFSKLNGTVSPEVQRIGYRVLENSTGTPVTIELTPLNPPIIIPPEGGNVDFGVFVENVSANPQNFSAWLDLVYEGGDPTTVVLRSFSNFQPGWTIDRPNMIFPVPGTYAAGMYNLTGKVGIYQAVVWDESGFNFEKSGTFVQRNFTPFIPAGLEDPFSEIITNDVDVTSLPSTITLQPAYPNPFNPSTTLSFSLPDAKHVELAVYNLSGQLVTTLVDGMVAAGSHAVKFDAEDLSSGIYLVRLIAGETHLIQKLTLIK